MDPIRYDTKRENEKEEQKLPFHISFSYFVFLFCFLVPSYAAFCPFVIPRYFFSRLLAFEFDDYYSYIFLFIIIIIFVISSILINLLL